MMPLLALLLGAALGMIIDVDSDEDPMQLPPAKEL